MKKNKKLIFLQLNEVNFSLIDKYFKTDKIKHFKKMCDDGLIETKSEQDYNLLEPWIQWYSVNTGLDAKSHGVFRLGDCINFNHKQFYEILEDQGLQVGAISPMNTENRLINPSYFISDPWTNTKSSGGIIIKEIARSLSQVINDNSQGKISLRSFIGLIAAFIFYSSKKRILFYIKLAFTGIWLKWRRAIFLDLLLHDLHIKLYKKYTPNLSVIFLNGCAHIQHHYFFNSFKSEKNKNPEWYVNKKYDPFFEVLCAYDAIIEETQKIEDIDFIMSTGLSQELNENAEIYYRLKNHEEFCTKLEIKYSTILPRMSRDFLINFSKKDHLIDAKKKLGNCYYNGEKLFGIIDEKNNSLFVSLTYNKEIRNQTQFSFYDKSIDVNNLFSFVAIKNGKHCQKGYLYGQGSIQKFLPGQESHVANIFNSILKYFVA